MPRRPLRSTLVPLTTPALAALAALLLPAAALRADTVRLSNGAVIHGKVEEAPAEGDTPAGLIVRIAGAGTIRLANSEVEGWERDDRGVAGGGAADAAPAPAPRSGATIATTHLVRLHNGEEFRGDRIEGDDPEAVTLRIGSLGTLAIPRDQVAEVLEERGSVTLPAPSPAPTTAPRSTPEPVADESAPTLEEIVAAIAADVVERHYAGGWRGIAPLLGPEQEAELAAAADELTRQRTTNRTRAEDTLRASGAAALPFIRPLATHPFALTRRAVQRLVRDANAWEGGPIAIAGLADSDEFVRAIAEEALIGILGPEVDAPLAGISPEAAWDLWLDVERRSLAAALETVLEEFLSEEAVPMEEPIAGR